MTTPNISAPEITESQINKYVTHNLALRYLDSLALGYVIAQQNAPPGSPADGDVYLVGTTGSGDWTGHDNEIAFHVGGAWAFITAKEGTRLYNQTDSSIYLFDGSTWAVYPSGGDVVGPASSVDNSVPRFNGTTGKLLQGSGVTIADDNKVSGVQNMPSQNLLIDGDFKIWTEGTSIATAGYKYFTGSWSGRRGTSATGATVTRQTGFSGAKYCLRYQRDIGNSSNEQLGLCQILTTDNSIKLAGKTITVSFDARKGADYSNTSSALRVEIISGTGTDEGGNPYALTTGSTSTSDDKILTTSATNYNFSREIPANATQIMLTFRSIFMVGTAGAADYFEITNVRLEIGNTASDYIPIPIEQEFKRLSWVYQKSYNYQTAPAAITTTGRRAYLCNYAFSNRIIETVQFYNRMRAAPTVTLYSPVTGATGKCDIAGADYTCTATASSETRFETTYNDSAVSQGNIIGYHWVADARL